ncbi:MAG: LuxR C-terminal-related transcriptional regulator [Rhodocyclaceae bacterium]
MMHNTHHVCDTVMPSERWRQAFPDGVCWDGLTPQPWAGQGAVLWLAVETPDWQTVLTAWLRAQPDARAVVVSLRPDDDEALLALQLGARGYCHALAVPEQLREVAQVVCKGGLWVGPSLLARVLGVAARALADRPSPPARPPVAWSQLSAREREVAEAVAEGLANREIGDRLGISTRTVKAHLGAVFEKLGVRDRLQLVVLVAGERVGAAAE